ncbi:MAG: 50S ribosomal protein L4 [Planctomycetes bacterium]|nr:50S ribosomal protein L4 [Planctomycetota bacterium]
MNPEDKLQGDADQGSAPEPAVFTVPRKSPSGETLSDLSISEESLDRRVRYKLLKDAVVMYAANRRRGTHDTKTRGDVTGSTRKLWRQKGTGRARAGSKKNPVWRGGGTIFGPHPRDYSYSINKKQKRLALSSALRSKFAEGRVLVLEGLDLDAPRTRAVAGVLKALGVEGRCLIGTAQVDRNLVLSTRNIPKVRAKVVSDLNAEDVLMADRLILTRDAFDRVSAGSLAGGVVSQGSEDASEGQEG